MSKQVREDAVYILFVGGAVLFFAALVLTPMLLGLFYSFTDYDGIRSDINLVGFENYRSVFMNKNFMGSIGFSVKYTVTTVILSNISGLGLALILNRGLKLQSILRTVFFVPLMIGLVTVGFLWKFILNHVVPFLGGILGFDSWQTLLLTQSTPAFWAICLIAVWSGVGYMLLLYLSGLQKIPGDLYEAAAIDGVNAWQRFRYVTCPLLSSTIAICTFLTLVNGMKIFDLPYALTQGGPFDSTQSIAYNIYQEAFQRGNYPLATAESFVFCVIVGIIGLTQHKMMNRKEVD